jgi:hypothetical protein
MDNNKKLVYCANSLFNISKDLVEINKSASMVCFALAKSLVDDITDLPEAIPEATLHSESSVHNTEIGKEIEDIVKQINEEDL